MNTSKKNIGSFSIFITRCGIIACVIQLTSLWEPVLRYKMQDSQDVVFVTKPNAKTIN